MWQHIFSMPVMRTAWRRELDSVLSDDGSHKIRNMSE
jgi:hypothetical protein